MPSGGASNRQCKAGEAGPAVFWPANPVGRPDAWRLLVAVRPAGVGLQAVVAGALLDDVDVEDEVGLLPGSNREAHRQEDAALGRLDVHRAAGLEGARGLADDELELAVVAGRDLVLEERREIAVGELH